MKKISILLIISLLNLRGFSQSGEINPNQGVSVPQFATVFINGMTTQPKGTVVFDKDLNLMKYWDGTTWQSMSVGSGIGWQANGNDISNTNVGNVGIGVANPLFTRLQINGNVGASVAMFGADKTGVSINADNPEIGLNYFFNGTTKTIKAGYGANIGMYPNNGDVYIGNFNGNQSSTNFGNIVGYQNVMTIKQNGNVGIGTTEPSSKLAVYGDSYFSGASTLNGGTSISAIVSNNADDGAIKIYSPNLSGSKYITIDKEAIQARRTTLTFPSSMSEQTLKLNPFGGNVGIGTGTTAVNATLYVIKSASSFDGTAVFKGTTHFTHFHYGANEDTYIRGGKDNSNIVLSDEPGGKVGIGIYPSSYKLEVNGTARAKEVIVETGWADYVFDESYKLRSIDEMERFIKENKHLPNIPKASEIENNGLKVGETNKAMMEKIEELALYIIQLKKEVDILKSKN